MGDERLDQQQSSDRVLQARARRLYDELRATLDELDRRHSSGRHAADQPKLRVINGGKAVIVAPFLWLGAQIRDHTAVSAATLGTVGVVAGAGTLGVGVQPPQQATADPTPPVMEQVEPEVYYVPESRPSREVTAEPTVGLQSPAPIEGEAAEAIDPPASTVTLTPLPTLIPAPTVTLTPPPEVVEPVEEVVWTKASALAHCRDELGLLPPELQECVAGLFAS